jgi:hypothetical protein
MSKGNRLIAFPSGLVCDATDFIEAHPGATPTTICEDELIRQMIARIDLIGERSTRVKPSTVSRIRGELVSALVEIGGAP